MQCRLRWHLHEIDPMLEVRPRGLRHGPAVSQVAERMADVAGPVAEIAHELLARCTEHNLEFEAGAEVTTWMKAASPACPLKGRAGGTARSRWSRQRRLCTGWVHRTQHRVARDRGRCGVRAAGAMATEACVSGSTIPQSEVPAALALSLLWCCDVCPFSERLSAETRDACSPKQR